MAFGIGINTNHPEHELNNGALRDVAVKCWFTASGSSTPLMLKVKLDTEEIISINNIQVITAEKQWYAGIQNIKYRCQAPINGRMVEFTLLFCPEECRWKLQSE